MERKPEIAEQHVRQKKDRKKTRTKHRNKGNKNKKDRLCGKKKHHDITMFAVREGCADHVVCKWGGCAPQPPCFSMPFCLQLERMLEERIWDDHEDHIVWAAPQQAFFRPSNSATESSPKLSKYLQML